MPAALSTTTAFEKPLRILKVMSDPRNSRLTEIARAAGIDTASASRALQVLVREGFVGRDQATKRYSYGDESYVLALALQTRRDLRAVARPSLPRLAEATGDMVSLLVRSGYEAVCVDLEAGDFPRQLSPMSIGIRRPLGVGAGSLALIAWNDPEDFEAVLTQIEPILARHSLLTRAAIVDEARAARERGYTRQYGSIAPQIGAIACPIRGIDGRICGAISISGLVRHLSSNEKKIHEMLCAEIERVELALRRLPVSVPGGK
jgi:DNA-binding IclR family transcriptional regulator